MITVSLVCHDGKVCFSFGIMGVVLQLTASPGEVNLVPLSLYGRLIFGLPTLWPGMGCPQPIIHLVRNYGLNLGDCVDLDTPFEESQNQKVHLRVAESR